ncbi:nicotinate-nucleotide--dimethylbenzimidazole phosphoribosyltransferase [Streptomyces sp. NPDC050263]|uniref:nicotinate-nucleotide--dimethylbenzimidazole phosphoribosyltransferase n=1 Tax=Streptomyces sp. NPDC050263 TaxID=3155037 RepID=UPI0034215A99
MTDTGQIPAEGLPESAGMVEQPGASAHGAYTYLSDTTAEDEDLLLLPGAQSAWGNEVAPPAPEPVVETVVHEPGPHETAGRDSGSVDLSAVRLPSPSAPQSAPRRPLHLGPPIPDASASPVRSLADRGPADAPVRQPVAPASGPEYLDAPAMREMPLQGASPWGAAQATAQATVQGPVASGVTTAETVAPAPAEPMGVAQAAVARVATEAIAATVPAVPQEPEAAVPGGSETYGVVDPGQLLGAAMMAEAEEAPAYPVADAGQIAAEVPVPGEDQAADVTPEPVVEPPMEAPQAPQAPEAPEAVQAVQAVEPAPVETVEQVPEVPEANAVEVIAAEEPRLQEQVAEVPAAEAVPVPVVDVVPEASVPDPAETPEPAATVTPETPAPVEEPAAPVAVVAEPAAPEAVRFAEVPAQQAEPELAVQPVPEVQPEPEPEPEPQPEPEVAHEAPAPVAIVEPVPESESESELVSEPAPEPQPEPLAEMTKTAEPTETTEPPVEAPVVAPEPPAAPLVEAVAAPQLPQDLPEQQSPQSELPPEPLQPAAASPEPPAEALVATPDPQPDRPATDQPVAEETTEQPVAEEPVAEQPVAEEPVAEQPVAQEPSAEESVPVQHVVEEPLVEEPLGEFVQVEGTVPTTPHLAPTPSHPIVLPTEEQPAPEAEAAAEAAAEPQQAPVTVPVPRAADPAPALAPAPDPAIPDAEQEADVDPHVAPDVDPDVAQSPEDLETRAADQEETPAAVEEVRESTGPAAPAYDDAEREAVLKVMRERRDIRNGFRGDPVPHEVLLRVLEAAHTAPSVGHSQPWDFVVIRSADTRRAMHELAMRQRDAYAKSLPKGRAKQFKELKIEAILDTPVNIVVTADPTRGGRHTLGRHTQPQMAPYSSALAVENLWLAARAEGLGVGWVSFFDEREMVRGLGLPDHLEVVAYLCVGYVDEFPDEPELMQAGWAKRRPLSWVVHEETYGRRALPGEDPHDLLAETVASVRPLDAKALGEAWERQKRMTKPPGSLGMLEIISAQLSGLSRQCPPPIPEPAAVAIFAGDHGVHAQGVTPWPQEVTAQMVANFLGGGAVCNAFASQVGAEVCVVDVGVASELPGTPGLLPRKIRAGTSDMTTGPAMTREEAKQAIEVGIETARDLVAAGNKALLTGEMGIANTTASAALISVFTGADPAEVTGRGTGINDETLARKTEVVRRALDLHQPDPADPIGVLAAVGGFEHAAMVGLLLGGASLRTPVILDGVSAGAAALVARAIAPEVLAACIAGHRSAEPGHVAALNKLGLRPLVDLDLRLGEGTGALLALPLVQSTARAMHEVATFDSAGVTEK